MIYINISTLKRQILLTFLKLEDFFFYSHTLENLGAKLKRATLAIGGVTLL